MKIVLQFLLLGLIYSLHPLEAATFTYSYDPLNRLTNAVYSYGSSEAYLYDFSGNRLSRMTQGVTYSLTLNASQGAISASPNQTRYYPNSVISITATPDPGYQFAGWTGYTNSSANPLALKMTTNITIKANFVEIGTETNIVFADNIVGDSIDTSKWITSGNVVIQTNGIMEVLTTVTDQGGNLSSIPVPINPHGDIIITRQTFVHYGGPQYAAQMGMQFGSLPLASVYYANYIWYDNPSYGWENRYGFYLDRYGAGFIDQSSDTNLAGPLTPIWDNWFGEKLVYSPDTGNLQYFTNDVEAAVFFIGIMPPTNAPTMQLSFNAWGWFTGHEQLFSNLVISQVSVQSVSPQFAAIIIGNGSVSLNLDTTFGNTYIIQSSSNLINWSAILTNAVPLSGASEINIPISSGQPAVFYRAVVY